MGRDPIGPSTLGGAEGKVDHRTDRRSSCAQGEGCTTTGGCGSNNQLETTVLLLIASMWNGFRNPQLVPPAPLPCRFVPRRNAAHATIVTSAALMHVPPRMQTLYGVKEGACIAKLHDCISLPWPRREWNWGWCSQCSGVAKMCPSCATRQDLYKDINLALSCQNQAPAPLLVAWS